MTSPFYYQLLPMSKPPILGPTLYGNSRVNLLRNCQTVFPSSYTILYSLQKCTRVLIFHILANPCYFHHYYCYFAILVGMKWYLVILISISLVTNDVEHLFQVFIGHSYIIFRKNVCFSPLPIFILGCLSFCSWAQELFIYFDIKQLCNI